MGEIGNKSVFDNIRHILEKMDEDWDNSDEITRSTYLVQDLGFQSIDIVVLGNSIDDFYQQALPFSSFFTEVGERQVNDIQFGELVDFVHQHLTKNSPPAGL